MIRMIRTTWSAKMNDRYRMQEIVATIQTLQTRIWHAYMI